MDIGESEVDLRGYGVHLGWILVDPGSVSLLESVYSHGVRLAGGGGATPFALRAAPPNGIRKMHTLDIYIGPAWNRQLGKPWLYTKSSHTSFSRI